MFLSIEGPWRGTSAAATTTSACRAPRANEAAPGAELRDEGLIAPCSSSQRPGSRVGHCVAGVVGHGCLALPRPAPSFLALLPLPRPSLPCFPLPRPALSLLVLPCPASPCFPCLALLPPASPCIVLPCPTLTGFLIHLPLSLRLPLSPCVSLRWCYEGTGRGRGGGGGGGDGEVRRFLVWGRRVLPASEWPLLWQPDPWMLPSATIVNYTI